MLMPMEPDPSNTPPAKRQEFYVSAIRASVGRCPNCGRGKLFRSYLKPVEHCSACGEYLGDIRAEDGPAWLTIMLVGHILAPVLLEVVPDSTWPDWLSMIVWPLMALLMALAILPRAKGFFIALIWQTRSVRA